MPIGSLKLMALKHNELMAALSKAEMRQPSHQPKEYELIEEIGKGQFGTVFRAYEVTQKKFFACKQMSLKIMRQKQAIEDLKSEIKHLKMCDHPNIIKLRDEKRTQDNHYLFFDYCNGGTLSDLKSITELGPLNEGVIRAIGLQILNGLKYLHSLNIVHRDLKNDNIMIHFPDLEEEKNFNPAMNMAQIQKKIIELLYKQRFEIKIADLGFSKQLDDIDDVMYTYCGTPLSMAPEIMKGKAYTYKADIWSVGVNLFVLITGVFPFFARSKPQLMADVEKGIYHLSKKTPVTPIFLDFINRCIQFN